MLHTIILTRARHSFRHLSDVYRYQSLNSTLFYSESLAFRLYPSRNMLKLDMSSQRCFPIMGGRRRGYGCRRRVNVGWCHFNADLPNTDLSLRSFPSFGITLLVIAMYQLMGTYVFISTAVIFTLASECAERQERKKSCLA